jgi:hypothetical protein
VDTLTADPPQSGAEPAADPTAAGAAPAPQPAGAPPPQPHAPTCRRCGAAMAPGQEWCLQCGTGVPGSLGSPGWRPTATIAAIVAVLVLAAAGAGYAALSKSPRRARVVTKTVAAAPAPVAPVTPTTTVPPAIKGVTPQPTAKAPRIPPITATPKALTPTAPATQGTGNSTTPTSPSGGGEEEAASNALVLDTNAASTYNPYTYPASIFGDPSLAIDGDSSTGWTAQVQAASAPRMAEGLVVDLKTGRRIATLKLVTTTPGMTVQVYGANSKALPNSITDPAWVPLSHSTIVKQRHAGLTLRESTHAFRFVTLWISSAPASSTPQAPGRVTVNELELIPAG